MHDAKRIYLRSLGLIGTSKKDERKAALDRAHLIRQFEIDLYWKRSNYFWLLQAAVFTALGLTWRGDVGTTAPIVPVALASLGAITSWAGWLATHGSRFWQRNWEHHIDMLESEFEGNLYKTVYIGPSGPKWSLSGVNSGLALCFFIFWTLLLVQISFSANPNWSINPVDISFPNGLEAKTIFCWILTAWGSFYLFRQGGGIKGDTVRYPAGFSREDDLPGKPQLWHIAGAEPYLKRREPNI